MEIMGKRVEFKRLKSQGAQPQKPHETIVYRVNITQFELSKLLYESEAFSRVELTASAKLFVWALCSHYNPDNETMFPAQATVAKRLGMSQRSAERAVKELRDKGLVTYTTKRVNHYVFSAFFFELLGLALLSGEGRQNVGSGGRQNVGLTNNHEQKKKKENFYFFKGASPTETPETNKRAANQAYSKPFYQNNWKNQQQQTQPRSAPSVEETAELIEKQAAERANSVNPFDFTRAEALDWLNLADEWLLKHSKIARHLIEKYELRDFQRFIM